MYSNQRSAGGGKTNSILNARWTRETAGRITSAVRAYTIRIAWVTLASAGTNMIVDAAQAGDSFDTTPHKVVRFKDLNLNSPEGIAALYGRIKGAASDVCSDPYRYDLSQLKLQNCIKDAVSRAITQVNNPMLTNLYQSKMGRTDKKATALAQAR